MAADLLHVTRCVVACDETTNIVIPFSSCRCELRQTAARCRLVALSLVFYRRVGFLSCCRMARCREHQSDNKPILPYESSDNVSSRHTLRVNAPFGVLPATGRQDDKAITCRLALCRTVAIKNKGPAIVTKQPP
jgi:hypothetical protein